LSQSCVSLEENRILSSASASAQEKKFAITAEPPICGLHGDCLHVPAFMRFTHCSKRKWCARPILPSLRVNIERKAGCFKSCPAFPIFRHADCIQRRIFAKRTKKRGLLASQRPC
jgi:hypothetical protein